MALATKCPQCGSMFRVVADQLKLRGGLVRCGQCRTVFDAIGSLAYVEETTLSQPRPVSGPVKEPAPLGAERSEAASARARAPAASPAKERTRSASDRKRKALGPATTLRIAPGAAPLATISQTLPSPPAATRRTRPMAAQEDAAAAGVPTLLAADPSNLPTAESVGSLEGIEVIEVPPVREPATVAMGSEQTPAFIRDAESEPPRGFSIFFTGGSLLLALLAVAQLAVIFRSDAISHWPATRPVLAQLCEVFGCTLGWPTQPDQLAVIGSELQSIAGTDVLELTAVIRNRAPFTQALPALEVTLSDSLNRPVARKVFTPVDYLAAAGEPRTRIDEGLGAGADMTIRVYLEARGVQAAGFLVYPFYI
jgi:predicted Zn finger-like uncharacterized protein